MAFTAGLVLEVESGGDDTNNGGGFDTGVAGFPTDLAATSGNTSAPVVTSASYTFVAGDVGAYVYVKSGTNWTPGWYPINSVSGGAATLGAGIGAATLANGRLTTVAGCATVASPSGGTWGLDYSRQTAAQITFTDLVIGATTTQFTSAAHPVGKNFVGNLVSVTSGTGFTVQRVAVVSTSGTTATCDKSLGTGGSTGGAGRLGGALATPQKLDSLGVAGHDSYIKQATYSGTVDVTFSVSGVNGADPCRIMGYATVRGDQGRPTIDIIAGNNFDAVTITGAYIEVYDLIATGHNDGTNRGAFICGSNPGTAVIRCKSTGLGRSGIPAFRSSGNQAGTRFIECECVLPNTSGAAAFSSDNNSFYYGCRATGGGGGNCDGFQLTAVQTAVMVNCVADTVDGHAVMTDGVGHRLIDHCVLRNPTTDGIYISADGRVPTVRNTIIEGCGGKDINAPSAIATPVTDYCAFFNNATPINSYGPNDVTLTADPHVNAAGGDLRLNETAGAGGACRGKGGPRTIPGLTPSNYPDIGLYQADPTLPVPTILVPGTARAGT